MAEHGCSVLWRPSVATCLCAALVGGAAPGAAQRIDPPSRADTARFLEQSTFGPTQALVSRVRDQGFNAFLAEQFAAEMTPYPELPPMPTTRPTDCTGTCQRDHYTMHLLQVHFFQNAVHGADQLRQRVAWALSQI